VVAKERPGARADAERDSPRLSNPRPGPDPDTDRTPDPPDALDSSDSAKIEARRRLLANINGRVSRDEREELARLEPAGLFASGIAALEAQDRGHGGLCRRLLDGRAANAGLFAIVEPEPDSDRTPDPAPTGLPTTDPPAVDPPDPIPADDGPGERETDNRPATAEQEGPTMRDDPKQTTIAELEDPATTDPRLKPPTDPEIGAGIATMRDDMRASRRENLTRPGAQHRANPLRQRRADRGSG
jgi:hypothetical protein